MDVKIAEWNLHGMTGTGIRGDKYLFPVNLIEHSIMKVGCPEILVFTEFVSTYYKSESDEIKENANSLKAKLEKMGYTMLWTDKTPQSRNGICIAVNENKMGKLEIKAESEYDEISPDYLAVGNDELVIFGVRLPSGSTNKQIEKLFNVMSSFSEQKIIAIGDFNKSYVSLINNRVVSKNKFYVHQCYIEDESNVDGLIRAECCSTLDHIITSFDTKIDWEYNWDHMIDLYESVKNKATYINTRSIPDHAMLVCEVKIGDK